MRIEDLDPARTKQEYADSIMRDLTSLGFEWEGEVVYQSKRTQAYEDALEVLRAKDLIYPCFCSRADLHAADAPHFGDEVVYQGTCRNLSTTERRERAQTRPPAQRVRVEDAPISFTDSFQGEQSFNLAQSSGDFIVQRSDGVFAYQLAVVVDDAAMGITSVVRGADLLTSTPRQIYLQDVLGLEHLEYAHLPLLVDGQGTRLAKRNEDESLAVLMDSSEWPPERILGTIAGIAGLIPAGERCSLETLISEANLNALRNVEQIVWNHPKG